MLVCKLQELPSASFSKLTSARLFCCYACRNKFSTKCFSSPLTKWQDGATWNWDSEKCAHLCFFVFLPFSVILCSFTKPICTYRYILSLEMKQVWIMHDVGNRFPCWNRNVTSCVIARLWTLGFLGMAMPHVPLHVFCQTSSQNLPVNAYVSINNTLLQQTFTPKPNRIIMRFFHNWIP